MQTTSKPCSFVADCQNRLLREGVCHLHPKANNREQLARPERNDDDRLDLRLQDRAELSAGQSHAGERFPDLKTQIVLGAGSRPPMCEQIDPRDRFLEVLRMGQGKVQDRRIGQRYPQILHAEQSFHEVRVYFTPATKERNSRMCSWVSITTPSRFSKRSI